MAEVGTVSDMGNVDFKGTVAALPANPKHGWMCYLPGVNKFYIYDGTANRWRAFTCTG